MADIKISQLGAAIAVGDTDLMPIVSGGNTLKATAAQVKEHSIGNTNISSIGDGSVTGAISELNTDKQPKTLATPLTIGGVSKTTVEDALGGLVSENQTLTNETSDIVNALGAKNLLPNKMTTKTVSGVTYTKRPDGSVVLTGTRETAGAELISSDWVDTDIGWIKQLEGKNVALSGGVEGANITVHFYGANNTYIGGGASPYGDGDTIFTVPSGIVHYAAYIYTLKDTFDGEVVKPMLRVVGTNSTYVPRAKTNKELTDLTNGVDSVIFKKAYSKQYTIAAGATYEIGQIATVPSGYTFLAFSTYDTGSMFVSPIMIKDNNFILKNTGSGSVSATLSGTAIFVRTDFRVYQ